MIFLPTSDELEEHLGKLSGFQLSIIQDRSDAARITVSRSSPPEHRDYHVCRNAEGMIERVEPCPPTGTLADGTPDHRPVVPSRHPDMSYDIAAMLHNVHLLVLEIGLADVRQNDVLRVGDTKLVVAISFGKVGHQVDLRRTCRTI